MGEIFQVMDKSNDIVALQNLDSSIDLLAAQNKLYGQAKTVLGIQYFLVISLAIVLGYYHTREVKPDVILNIGSGVIFIVNLLIRSVRKSKHELAALIQEKFDTKVLSLKWSESITNKPRTEDIVRILVNISSEEKESMKLRDWYPIAINSLSLDQARLLCQRINLSWDQQLRKNHIFRLLGCLLIISIGLTCYHSTSLVFDAIYECLIWIPVYSFIFSQIWGNFKGIISTDKLKTQFDFAVDVTLSKDKVNLADVSRNLQNLIFYQRKYSPLIFDWIYKIDRKKQEKEMIYFIEHYVEECNESKA